MVCPGAHPRLGWIIPCRTALTLVSCCRRPAPQDGVAETGVSVAYTVLACDAGPVLAQQRVRVGDAECKGLGGMRTTRGKEERRRRGMSWLDRSDWHNVMGSVWAP